jgi:cysteinyl-tRNA synthetase
MPRAMAVVQELLKSDLSAADKHATVMDFDQILGLNLDAVDQEDEMPEEVVKMAAERQQARADKDWGRADELRDAILEKGFVVQDTKEGPKILKA